MICKYCQHEISNTANFCEECGFSVNGKAGNNTSNMNPKRRTNLVSFILAVLIVLSAFVVVFKIGGTERALNGVWADENTFTYTFQDGVGTNTYSADSQTYTTKEAEFTWHITDDKNLIILWSDTSCTNYTWNPNYNSYKLSANEYNWYVKGNKLYLSTSASELGYNEYTRQAK